jgi:hypothetical protein
VFRPIAPDASLPAAVALGTRAEAHARPEARGRAVHVVARDDQQKR